MESSTLLYIVVVDVESASVRAVLFDSGAQRVEGYRAELPNRPDAVADCLDDLHRQIRNAELRIAAVVGVKESDTTPTDRATWTAFANARWFPPLPELACVALGSGCISGSRFCFLMGPVGSLSAIILASGPQAEACAAIVRNRTVGQTDDTGFSLWSTVDDDRFVVGETMPETTITVKGSLDALIESAVAGDERLRQIESLATRFRQAYEKLSARIGKPETVVASGTVLLKSSALTRMIADALGAPVTLCTELEPSSRGAALWALEKIGAIKSLNELPASTAGIFCPRPVHERPLETHL